MVSSFPDVVLRPLSSGRSMPTNVKAAAFEPLVLKGSRKISSGGESVVTNHASVFSFSAAVSGFSAGIHFSFLNLLFSPFSGVLDCFSDRCCIQGSAINNYTLPMTVSL